MAKKGKKLSNETKKKLSKSLKGKTPWNKGRTGLQTAWNKGKKGSIPWNKGRTGICSADGCENKRQAKGYCDYHYRRFTKGIPFDKIKQGEMRKKNCLISDCKEKAYSQFYCERHFNIFTNAKRSKKAVDLLGGKCESCGEIHNPKLSKTNLEIHHRFYDDLEIEQKKAGKQRSGSQLPMEILRKAKNGINPKKKFALLCKQCHAIETTSHQNPKKAFDMFAWMYGEGLFDEVLKDDPKLKKLTEFIK